MSDIPLFDEGEYLDAEHYEIIGQLRSRNLGKGILEERAAKALTKARKQAKSNEKRALLWRAYLWSLKNEEAQQVIAKAECSLASFLENRRLNLADAGRTPSTTGDA